MERVFKKHELKKTYYRVPGVNILVYEPVDADCCPESRIMVASMHGSPYPDLNHIFIEGIAACGFRSAYCVPDDTSFITQFQVMNGCVEFLYGLEGVEKLVLMGQSRGAGLMSGYQRIAENGVDFYQQSDRLLPFPDMKLRPADGLMLLDANFGFMVMHLMSMSPAIITEGNALHINSGLDPLNTNNGFAPDGKSRYSEDFRRRYLGAQRARYLRILDNARERAELLAKGQGNYFDDEPLFIADSMGGNHSAKLFSSDLRLLSHTREAWPLLHPDGSLSTEIVPSVRPAEVKEFMPGKTRCIFRTTVKELLWIAVEVGEDYDYGEDYLQGINFDSSVTCSAGNVKHISCPLLLMGHTAGYEYINAEWAYKNAKSEDKTIAFSEGLTHGWTVHEPDKYEGAFEAQLDYVGRWLMEKGRFLN